MRDMINPIISRMDDFKIPIDAYSRKVETFESRIADIEYILYKSQTATSRWEEMQTLFNQLEAEVRLRDNDTHSKISELTYSTSFFTQKFNNIDISHNELSKELSDLESKLFKCEESISKVKSELFDVLNKQNTKLQNKFILLDDELKNTSKTSFDAFELANQNLARLNTTDNILKELESSLTQFRNMCLDMEMNKVNNTVFERYRLEVSNRILMTEFNIKTKMNHLISTDSFIDEYLPIKIQ